MTVRVEHDNCLQAIPRLVAEGVVCDAVVTDAPYHLVQIAERSKYPVKYGKDGAMQRLLTGFMGQTWDGGDIAFRPETWATIATILRPGAFLVAFGGTRTYHRLVCAIEDAGFVIQDQIAWMFGSGFPKRRDALKPAHEPICLAYKPGGKRTMQVDECRIGTTVETWPASRAKPVSNALYTHRLAGDDRTITVPTGDTPPGRWPANVAHDGSDEVLAAFPETTSGTFAAHHNDGGKGRGILGAMTGRERQHDYTGSTGSAARFFYTAKADKQDRWGSRHPTVKPINLIRWLVRLVTPPGGLVLDPFAGSGTTGAAAFAEGRNAILIEREAEYIADIERRIASLESSVNQHSAVTRAVVRAVKTRQRIEPMPVGGLFDRPYDESADLAGSYYAAIEEIGRRVKAGESVPECMLKQKEP